jgi:3-hydroxyisobutyrate dehydrogenase-like beta-hydroxyacid dehydrogenase
MKYFCIIGYGTLGKKIFEVLSNKYSKIKIFNRSHKKLNNVLASKKFTTVDEAFRNSNIIFFIVKDHHSIEYFFKKIKDKKLLKNKVFVNISTITYNKSIEFNNFAKKNNSRWIEAPTLGSVESLLKKNMSFLYAGPKNVSVIKILKKIGKINFFKQIHHPQILKIIHNSICANIMIALGDAFLIAKKNNIVNKIMSEMLTNSAFFSPLINNKLKKINSGYDVSFSYANMLKDLKIFKNSNFHKTEVLQHTFKTFNKFKIQTKNKDSSYIIKKISKI